MKNFYSFLEEETAKNAPPSDKAPPPSKDSGMGMPPDPIGIPGMPMGSGGPPPSLGGLGGPNFSSGQGDPNAGNPSQSVSVQKIKTYDVWSALKKNLNKSRQSNKNSL